MPVNNVPSTESHYADISCLDDVGLLFRKDIACAEITSTEDVYDEDNGRVYRVFNFNRGLKNFFAVIHPDFFVKGVSTNMPPAVLVKITNILVQSAYQIMGEIYE